MNNTKNYANQWDISAQFFYEKGYYSWMAQRINKFQTVVEVGCGTGYSTLALVENGHKVIAIDKNRDCIAKAKQLLLNRGIAECIFRKNCASVPEERSAIPLQTEQSSAG